MVLCHSISFLNLSFWCTSFLFSLAGKREFTLMDALSTSITVRHPSTSCLLSASLMLHLSFKPICGQTTRYVLVRWHQKVKHVWLPMRWVSMLYLSKLTILFITASSKKINAYRNSLFGGRSANNNIKQIKPLNFNFLVVPFFFFFMSDEFVLFVWCRHKEHTVGGPSPAESGYHRTCK